MPYNGPEMLGLIESWYPAGTTPTQAAVQQTIFSDTTSSSKPLTVTVDLGPFGTCYLLSVPQSMAGSVGYGPDCFPLTPPAATVLSLRHYPIGGRDLMLTEVNTRVDHVDATLSDGTTTLLIPVRVGGHSFVVTFLAAGVTLSGARAYDSSGTQLATGS
jgi:hypothetical protein